MLRVVDIVLSALVPSCRLVPIIQTSGYPPTHRQWFRKKGVLWFNGYPGWPKLPLVQRRRASPSSLNLGASSQPDEEQEMELDDDPEPLY